MITFIHVSPFLRYYYSFILKIFLNLSTNPISARRHFSMALVHLLAFWMVVSRTVTAPEMRTSNSDSKTSISMDIKSVVHLPSLRMYLWRTDVELIIILSNAFSSGFCVKCSEFYVLLFNLHLKYSSHSLPSVQSLFFFSYKLI